MNRLLLGRQAVALAAVISLGGSSVNRKMMLCGLCGREFAAACLCHCHARDFAEVQYRNHADGCGSFAFDRPAVCFAVQVEAEAQARRCHRDRQEGRLSDPDREVDSKLGCGGAVAGAGNIILGGVIGGIVDGTNGSMNNLTPNPLKITLVPVCGRG